MQQEGGGVSCTENHCSGEVIEGGTLCADDFTAEEVLSGKASDLPSTALLLSLTVK